MIAIESVFQYISRYLLKSGEQLDVSDSTVVSSVVDVVIVKRTARTMRKVGILTLSFDTYSQDDDTQPPDTQLLYWTPGKRATLKDNSAYELLNMGWIIKEMRFKMDGKTVERVHYRMGHRLFVYLQKKREQENEEQLRHYTSYQIEAQKLLSSLVCEDRERETILSSFIRLLSDSVNWHVDELAESDYFPSSWSTAKRIKWLTFLLAFTIISSRKDVFDWKEIGAQYYGGIGGSKAFDDHKDEFISFLEEKGEQAADILGMISHGTIIPLYFAGQLNGQWSCFKAGPVHALTDISIIQDQYSTDATTLWLVENRGILTRFSAERHFLEETGSIMVCIDGHLRSSHKKFIHNLLINSSIRQAIFWSDYDEDGLLIAGEMLKAVTGFPLMLKWICHNHKVVINWSEYEQYMKALLQEDRLEQEQILGEAEDWKRWINH